MEALELELHAPSYAFLEEQSTKPPVPVPRRPRVRQLSSSDVSTTTMETVSELDTDSDIPRDSACDMQDDSTLTTSNLTITRDSTGKREVRDAPLTPRKVSFGVDSASLSSHHECSVSSETIVSHTVTGVPPVVAIPPLLSPKSELKAKITLHSGNLAKAINEEPQNIIERFIPTIMKANKHYPGGMVTFLHQCGLFHSQDVTVEHQDNGDLRITVPWGNLDLYQMLPK
jgi:hypothetical protein